MGGWFYHGIRPAEGAFAEQHYQRKNQHRQNNTPDHMPSPDTPMTPLPSSESSRPAFQCPAVGRGMAVSRDVAAMSWPSVVTETSWGGS
ncbi:MAG: hypothetical protein HC828_15240, partial [Blastochloris sp.]|nr:hypothetical protein [Blastochloris sp.]